MDSRQVLSSSSIIGDSSSARDRDSDRAEPITSNPTRIRLDNVEIVCHLTFMQNIVIQAVDCNGTNHYHIILLRPLLQHMRIDMFYQPNVPMQRVFGSKQQLCIGVVSPHLTQYARLHYLMTNTTIPNPATVPELRQSERILLESRRMEYTSLAQDTLHDFLVDCMCFKYRNYGSVDYRRIMDKSSILQQCQCTQLRQVISPLTSEFQLNGQCIAYFDHEVYAVQQASFRQATSRTTPISPLDDLKAFAFSMLVILPSSSFTTFMQSDRQKNLVTTIKTFYAIRKSHSNRSLLREYWDESVDNNVSVVYPNRQRIMTELGAVRESQVGIRQLSNQQQISGREYLFDTRHGIPRTYEFFLRDDNQSTARVLDTNEINSRMTRNALFNRFARIRYGGIDTVFDVDNEGTQEFLQYQSTSTIEQLSTPSIFQNMIAEMESAQENVQFVFDPIIDHPVERIALLNEREQLFPTLAGRYEIMRSPTRPKHIASLLSYFFQHCILHQMTDIGNQIVDLLALRVQGQSFPIVMSPFLINGQIRFFRSSSDDFRTIANQLNIQVHLADPRESLFNQARYSVRLRRYQTDGNVFEQRNRSLGSSTRNDTDRVLARLAVRDQRMIQFIVESTNPQQLAIEDFAQHVFLSVMACQQCPILFNRIPDLAQAGLLNRIILHFETVQSTQDSSSINAATLWLTPAEMIGLVDDDTINSNLQLTVPDISSSSFTRLLSKIRKLLSDNSSENRMQGTSDVSFMGRDIVMTSWTLEFWSSHMHQSLCQRINRAGAPADDSSRVNHCYLNLFQPKSQSDTQNCIFTAFRGAVKHQAITLSEQVRTFFAKQVKSWRLRYFTDMGLNDSGNMLDIESALVWLENVFLCNIRVIDGVVPQEILEFEESGTLATHGYIGYCLTPPKITYFARTRSPNPDYPSVVLCLIQSQSPHTVKYFANNHMVFPAPLPPKIQQRHTSCSSLPQSLFLSDRQLMQSWESKLLYPNDLYFLRFEGWNHITGELCQIPARVPGQDIELKDFSKAIKDNLSCTNDRAMNMLERMGRIKSVVQSCKMYTGLSFEPHRTMYFDFETVPLSDGVHRPYGLSWIVCSSNENLLVHENRPISSINHFGQRLRRILFNPFDKRGVEYAVMTMLRECNQSVNYELMTSHISIAGYDKHDNYETYFVQRNHHSGVYYEYGRFIHEHIHQSDYTHPVNCNTTAISFNGASFDIPFVIAVAANHGCIDLTKGNNIIVGGFKPYKLCVFPPRQQSSHVQGQIVFHDLILQLGLKQSLDSLCQSFALPIKKQKELISHSDVQMWARTAETTSCNSADQGKSFLDCMTPYICNIDQYMAADVASMAQLYQRFHETVSRVYASCIQSKINELRSQSTNFDKGLLDLAKSANSDKMVEFFKAYKELFDHLQLIGSDLEPFVNASVHACETVSRSVLPQNYKSVFHLVNSVTSHYNRPNPFKFVNPDKPCDRFTYFCSEFNLKLPSFEPFSPIQFPAIDRTSVINAMMSFLSIDDEANLFGQLDAWCYHYEMIYGMIDAVATKETDITLLPDAELFFFARKVIEDTWFLRDVYTGIRWQSCNSDVHSDLLSTFSLRISDFTRKSSHAHLQKHIDILKVIVSITSSSMYLMISNRERFYTRTLDYINSLLVKIGYSTISSLNQLLKVKDELFLFVTSFSKSAKLLPTSTEQCTMASIALTLARFVSTELAVEDCSVYDVAMYDDFSSLYSDNAAHFCCQSFNDLKYLSQRSKYIHNECKQQVVDFFKGQGQSLANEIYAQLTEEFGTPMSFQTHHFHEFKQRKMAKEFARFHELASANPQVLAALPERRYISNIRFLIPNTVTSSDIDKRIRYAVIGGRSGPIADNGAQVVQVLLAAMSDVVSLYPTVMAAPDTIRAMFNGECGIRYLEKGYGERLDPNTRTIVKHRPYWGHYPYESEPMSLLRGPSGEVSWHESYLGIVDVMVEQDFNHIEPSQFPIVNTKTGALDWSGQHAPRESFDSDDVLYWDTIPQDLVHLDQRAAQLIHFNGRQYVRRWLHSCDISLLIQRGYDVKLLHAYVWTQHSYTILRRFIHSVFQGKAEQDQLKANKSDLYNPALREIFKLIMNASFGSLLKRNFSTKVTSISDLDDLRELCESQKVNLAKPVTIRRVGDRLNFVQYESCVNDELPESAAPSIIGCSILTYSRLYMYITTINPQFLAHPGRTLYMDTDSCFWPYACESSLRTKLPSVQISGVKQLGQFEEELRAPIIEKLKQDPSSDLQFCAVLIAPKEYYLFPVINGIAYVQYGKAKVKGVSQMRDHFVIDLNLFNQMKSAYAMYDQASMLLASIRTWYYTNSNRLHATPDRASQTSLIASYNRIVSLSVSPINPLIVAYNDSTPFSDHIANVDHRIAMFLKEQLELIEGLIQSIQCPFEFDPSIRSSVSHAGCSDGNHFCGSIKHNLAGYVQQRVNSSINRTEKTRIVAIRAVNNTRLFGNSFSIDDIRASTQFLIRTNGGSGSLTPDMFFKSRFIYTFKELSGSSLPIGTSLPPLRNRE